MEGIKEKLRKIYARIEGGSTPGERATAEIQFQKLLTKHNLTPADIVDEATERFYFRVETEWQRRLLFQIYAAVCKTRNVNYFKISRKKYWFTLTRLQNVEINFLYSEHKAAFKKQFQDFQDAYFHANSLLAPGDDSGDAPEPTPEEIEEWMRILRMAANLEKVSLNRKRLN